MFIINSYTLAVLFSVITMICWGSWANTQKMASKTWRFELFYWDYVIGILLLSIIMGFTMGSSGDAGRSFVQDLKQVDSGNFWSAFIGGVVFNMANILLSAAVAISGMAVAFPLGVGIALVLGVFVNYFGEPKGNPTILFLGVALVAVAIVLNGIAAAKNSSGESGNQNKKGIVIALVAGVLMSFFFRFVANSMDLSNFVNPEVGKATPYSAFFIFSLGIFISNFIINTLVMKKPFVGESVSYNEYFKGSGKTHLIGILGGIIWGVGTLFSYIAAEKAGPAISYALGQGAPMVAAIWGIFVWKEFKGSTKTTNWLLLLMFVFFIAGLGSIILSGAQ